MTLRTFTVKDAIVGIPLRRDLIIKSLHDRTLYVLVGESLQDT